MVYYSGLPLLMTQQQQQQQQQHGPDGTILQLNYNDATSAEQYAISGQPSRNGGPNAYQPQQQHHTISLTNGLTISNGPQSCNSSSSSSSSNGQLTIVLNPSQGQSSNMTTTVLPGAYGAPISPRGERGPSSSPEQSSYSGQMSSPAVSSKFRCEQCNISFGSKSAHTSHMKSHAKQQQQQQQQAAAPEGGGCKLEDVSASGTDGSAPSSTLESAGGNSNSNSNSSFEYSSSVSHTEGTDHTPSSDERSGQASASEVGRFTILKLSSPSPRSSVGMNDEPPASVDEEEDEEDEEVDEEEEDNDRKQIRPYDGELGQSFDESLQRAYGNIPTGGVAPALLAAASIAAAVENGCTEVKFCPEMKPRSISPVQPSAALSITRITPPPSSGSSSSSSSSSSSVLSIPAAVGVSSTLLEPTAGSTTGMVSGSGQYMYEPLAIMKHHGYFAPASQITDYRSSSDIVRQVEAAIAGTENLLTPPRSSPESPDRSSSPESDSVLMADRDNNTLPPRKRKLYFKDNQQQPHTASVPKLAALDTVVPAQHYSVQQPQQPLSLDVHADHQQLFHHQPVPAQRHTAEQTHQQPAYHHHHHHQPRPEEQRSVKLEVLQNVSPSREEVQHRRQQQSPTPTQPQTTTPASVIRMSSVIQYANKSS
uniref:Uncharacterized protein n=1 Tax=Anopheles stephensi TaxID=30069 RepID=A0A182Y8A6_ANOST